MAYKFTMSADSELAFRVRSVDRKKSPREGTFAEPPEAILVQEKPSLNKKFFHEKARTSKSQTPLTPLFFAPPEDDPGRYTGGPRIPKKQSNVGAWYGVLIVGGGSLATFFGFTKILSTGVAVALGATMMWFIGSLALLAFAIGLSSYISKGHSAILD